MTNQESINWIRQYFEDCSCEKDLEALNNLQDLILLQDKTLNALQYACYRIRHLNQAIEELEYGVDESLEPETQEEAIDYALASKSDAKSMAKRFIEQGKKLA